MAKVLRRTYFLSE